ncbi:MAG: TetR family transcriptional regulator, partial [Comamonadaceae bacterium]
LATRHALLDAAERLFQAHGVSGTSLQDIALAAGATRGAVYWHFKDKADLFNAMMERVTLPLEHALDDAGAAGDVDALQAMRRAILLALKKAETDPQTRRVFEVATHKVEYVESLAPVRQRHLQVREDCLGQMKQALLAAARVRGARLPVPAEAAARGLHALVDGLIQNWLLDSTAFRLEATGRRAIDAYLAGLGLASSTAAR